MSSADDFAKEVLDAVERSLAKDSGMEPDKRVVSERFAEVSTTLRQEIARLATKHLDLTPMPTHPRFSIGEESASNSPCLSRVASMATTNPLVASNNTIQGAANKLLQAENSKCAMALPEDEQAVMNDLFTGRLKHRKLETRYSPEKSISFRRKHIERLTGKSLHMLPFEQYDYTLVSGACCENIIGYMPLPTGIAGPLKVNGELLYIPMATTEGALIASTNRGCKALYEGGQGVTAECTNDGMTRAPVIKFENLLQALECKNWLEQSKNFELIRAAFNASSRYLQLLRVTPHVNGPHLFVRFTATTGDAMGMNMVTKGTEEAIRVIQQHFPNYELVSISGNMCVDKKASALNWIEGRGKSVVADAVISAHTLREVLKTDVPAIVRLANTKLHIGSSNAVCIGGSNAHAANVVAAIFLATGQDAAQVLSSSMCTTQVQETATGDLYVSVTMNCMEVGTVGGGTILAPQQTSLGLLGCSGPSKEGMSGENSKRLAKIICATVLAGELSLLASQCTGDLVRSHLRLNRSNRDLANSTTCYPSMEFAMQKKGVEDRLTALTFQPSTKHQHRGAQGSGQNLARYAMNNTKVITKKGAAHCMPL